MILYLKSFQDITQYPTPSDIDAIVTHGYYEFGDGGSGLYKRVAVIPTHSGYGISATGGIFELSLGQSNNVKQYGAKGDGIADDTLAVQSAINRPNANCVGFPSGTYKVTNTLTVLTNITLKGEGYPVIKAYHNGDVFQAIGIPGVNIFPDNKVIFEGLSFKNNLANTPASYIRLGNSDSIPVTYVHSVNDAEINGCSFQSCAATYVIDNNRGFGLTIRGCLFTAITADAVLKLRQNQNELPYWSYGVNVHSSDFTGITGKAIESDGGDLTIFGGIIEGCSLGGVEAGINTAYLGSQPVSFYGTYFEQNSEFHFKSNNDRVNASFHGSKFVGGGLNGNRILIAGASHATFYNCSSPNTSPIIIGGNIRQYGCSYMSGNIQSNNSFHSDKQTLLTSTPDTPLALGPLLNVNGSIGGGGALIICSHSTGGALACNAELFFIMFGVNGNRFTVQSVSRIVGADTTAYTFSVDADGYLQVASAAGNARYHVIAQTNGVYIP